MTYWKLGRLLVVSCVAAVGLSGCWPFSSDDDDKQETAAPVQPAQVAPTITTQPAALSVAAGSSAATFTVVATGTPAPTYQWQRDGTNISGATSASYTLPTATPADAGAAFRVVVTNAAGSITSSAAALNVSAPGAAAVAPGVAVQPQSANALDGTTATLSVVATGTDPFTYVWRRNGAVIADANAATYATPALSLGDSGAVFTVTVGNAAGTVVSSNAVITVNPVSAAVVTQPLAVSVTAGQTATFSVAATGSATLAYQWRRNGTAITGATAASYTTPATTAVDSGARFSVVVSNSGGNATSADAVLSVTAGAVAPAVATAPASLSVSEGQAASFSVMATGTAPLTYQWRRNGADIAGATNASYTLTTVLADNTARISVRVSNAAGTVTSADAVLSVQAVGSNLAGRGWVTGQSLESGASTVATFRAGLDDAGNAVAVYAQNNGTRLTLYAVHGQPGATGQAPAWTAPVVIDMAGTVAYTLATCILCETPYVAVAPNGNAVAIWPSSVACTTTSYNTSGTCQTLFAAHYDSVTKTWAAPVRVADTPSVGFNQGESELRINNRGDVALLYSGWVRGSGLYGNFISKLAVASRAAGQATYQTRAFDVDSASFDFGMDDAGNMVAAGTVAQNSTTDYVAYRGNVATSFGAQEIIDARSSAATGGVGVRVGRNGQVITFYTQNNGTSQRLFAATASSANAAFTVVDLAASVSSATVEISAADSGNALLYYGCSAYQWTASTNAWSAPKTMPGNCQTTTDVARNGNSLRLTSMGLWSTYDAATNTMVQPYPSSTAGLPGSAYVYGVSASLRKSLNGGYQWFLSPSGVGLFITFDAYDVLPTAAAPSGDGRPAVLNLWGVYFK